MRRCSATSAFAPSSMPPSAASLRSAPEQNTRSAERISTTRDVGVLLGPVEGVEELGHQLAGERVAVVR